jgi:hypothetical protein
MESSVDKMTELKLDIQTIKNKINECKNKDITDGFIIEMTIMEELPELYTNYPFLIKKLLKNNSDDTYLNKFINELDGIVKGEQSLASVELKLGMELKQQFIDPILEQNIKNK